LFDNLQLNIAKECWWIWIGNTKGNTVFYISKWIPGSISKITNKLAIALVFWKYHRNQLILLFDNLQWTFPLKIDGFGLAISKLRKLFIQYSKWIPGSISKKSIKLLVAVVQWVIQWKSLFSHCLIIFHWTLARTFYGFRLAKLKLRDNSSFNIPNGFLEEFPKSQTCWLWQWYNGKYHGSHCFVWQSSTEHCLKMLMDLNWPYQSWGKRIHSIFWMDFWKCF